MKTFLLILTIIISSSIMAQSFEFEQHLYQTYERYKEKSLTHRRFKHADILPLIEKLKANPEFRVTKAGESVEGRSLNLISAGKGKTKIFLWSQMHGDEPTATAALFDIFNFLSDSVHRNFTTELYKRVTLYFMPMVNPDGAERFKRRNFYDIDLNRDASRLQCPEAIVLKKVFDELKADFGFNLHDQSHRYSAGHTFKSAALSFLAPAFNYQKDFDSVRNKAVQVIGGMYQMLSKFVPGHIGKYSDDFEPRAFGDNFQKWGASTILIESGGWKDDPEKQFLRKLNFMAILSAVKSIAEESYALISRDIYESIPFNDDYIFDLVLRNVQIRNGNEIIRVDVAVNLDEIQTSDGKFYYFRSQVADLGDLSIFYGYRDFDFSGYTIKRALTDTRKVYRLENLGRLDFYDFYSKGYANILVDKLPQEKFSPYPINLAGSEIIDTTINIGEAANFLLERDGKIEYIVINGFLQKVEKNRKFEGNGMIIR